MILSWIVDIGGLIDELWVGTTVKLMEVQSMLDFPVLITVS
jgi:hypothetical protein